MMTSKAWCRSRFRRYGPGPVSTSRPGRPALVGKGRPHEVSVPSGDRRRQRPGVSGGVPHNSRSDGVGGVADGLGHRPLGRERPTCPRSMKRPRVWRETLKRGPRACRATGRRRARSCVWRLQAVIGRLIPCRNWCLRVGGRQSGSSRGDVTMLHCPGEIARSECLAGHSFGTGFMIWPGPQIRLYRPAWEKHPAVRMLNGFANCSLASFPVRWRSGTAGCLPPQVGAGDDEGQDAQPRLHRLPLTGGALLRCSL